MSIPAWTATGVLPPIRPGADQVSISRSPYGCAVDELVERFGTSAERARILDGLVAYRDALANAGVDEGFQWIDGSFVEDTEANQRRPPNDIDLVTFLRLPKGVPSQRALVESSPELFGREKERFRVDAYYVVIGEPLNATAVDLIAYWYSLWSHRRDGVWKGFLAVGLDREADDRARVHLDRPADLEDEGEP